MRISMFIIGTVGLLLLLATTGARAMFGEVYSASTLNLFSFLGLILCFAVWVAVAFWKSPSENAGLLEGISEAVFIIDRNHRNVMSVNQATIDLLEFHRDDLLYRPASHLFAGNETTVDKLLAFDGSQETADPIMLTVSAMRKNGSLVTMQLTSRPVRYHNNNCVMINGRDISETVKANEDQARLASILESNTSGLCAANQEGIITNWNKAATKILGYRAKEIIGKPFMTIVQEQHRKQRWDWYKNLLSGNNLPVYESAVIHKNGYTVLIQIDASPIRNAKGEVTGASVLFRDIEKDKKSKEEIKKNAQLLEITLKTAQLVLWEFDRNEQTISLISGPRDDIFGYPPGTIFSYPKALGLIHALDRQQIDMEMQYVLESTISETLNFKARVLCADGIYRWTRITGHVTERDDKGFPVKIVGVQLDISKEITEKQREESEKLRIKTLLAWSERTNASREDILDFTLQKAVELTGSAFGLIGQVDKTKSQLNLSWPAQGGLPHVTGTVPPHKNANQQFDISGSALWTKAVHAGEPVVSNAPSLNDQDRDFFGKHNSIERYMTIPILDEGQVAGVVMVANKEEGYASHDVIELQLLAQGMWSHIRKIELENARKQAELEKNIILDNLQEGVVCVAEDQRITYANRSACEMFGKPMEEVVGHSYTEACPSATHCDTSCVMHDVIELKQPCHKEITTVEGDRYDLKACPICDERGDIFRVIETFCAIAPGTSPVSHQENTTLG